MNRRDLRVAEALLAPEYVIPLARELGNGDPVVGARAAWLEVRGLLREWVRHVRQRDKGMADLGIAFSFKHLGLVGNYCEVLPVTNERWRITAAKYWDTASPIIGGSYVSVGDHTQKEVNYSAMRALSKTLRLVPASNRAFLDGRCWQRITSEIMVNFELRGEMNSTIFDAEDKSDAWMGSKLHRAVKSARKLYHSELSEFGADLIDKWATAGFISSPAGAMVSLMGNTGLPFGYAPLIPSNGVPITMVVGAVDPDINKVMIGGMLDHRVMDGRTTARVTKMIKEEMECELS